MVIRALPILLLALVGSDAVALAQLTPPDQEFTLHFDERIAIAPLDEKLSLGETFTIEAWIFVKEYAKGPELRLMGVWEPTYADPWYSYALLLLPDGQLEYLMSASVPGSLTSVRSDPLELEEWAHVAAVHTGSKIRLLINGVVVGEADSPGSPSNTKLPFAVGGLANDNQNDVGLGFIGSIAQVRMWDRALSSQEIKAQAGAYLTGSESGLLAYWPFDDGAGVVARDLGPWHLDMQLGLGPEPDFARFIPRWFVTEFLVDPVFEVTYFENPADLIASVMWLTLLDLGGDSDLDAVVAQVEWPARYPDPNYRELVALENDGSAGFTDATDAVFDQVLAVDPRSLAVGDFNGDGLDDLFIADEGSDTPPFPGGPNRLFFQGLEGNLEDVSESHFPPNHGFSHSTDAADFDSDGDLDLVVLELSSSEGETGLKLYVNDELGHFSESKGHSPDVVENGHNNYLTTAVADVDKDGDPDLILGGWGTHTPSEHDALMLNDGTGRFDFAPEGSMPGRKEGPDHDTIAISSSDFDGDGWPDLALSNMKEYTKPSLQILLNNQDGTFRDATERTTQTARGDCNWYKQVLIHDFNDDGWVDLLVTCFLSTNGLFLNRGEAVFDEASEVLQESLDFGAQFAGDLDGDGDIDMVGVDLEGRGPTLWRNVRAYQPSPEPLLSPAIPTQVAPSAGSTTSRGPVLDWEDVPRVGSYELQIATTRTFAKSPGSSSIVVDEKRLYTSDFMTARLEDGLVHYWRVRSVNVAGHSDWSSVSSFLTENQPPSFITSILDVAQEGVPYKMIVELDDPDGDTLEVTAPDIPAWLSISDSHIQSVTLSGTPTPGAEGAHEFTLRASDGIQQTDKAFTLTVTEANRAPSAPVILFPGVGTRLTVAGEPSDGVTFSWTAAQDADGDTLAYTWKMSRSMDLSAPLLRIETSDTTHTETVEGLATMLDTLGVGPGGETTLYHQVTATDGFAVIESNLVDFVLQRGAVTSVRRSEDTPLRLELMALYPNPSSDHVSLHLASHARGPLTATVYDLLGRKALRKVWLRREPGYQDVELDVGKLAPGTYVLLIEGQSERLARMFVVGK